MNTKIVMLKDIEEGMLTAEDYFRNNVLIIAKGSVVNKSIMEELKKNNVASVKVESASTIKPMTKKQSINLKNKKFSYMYDSSLDFSKNTIKQVMEGECIDSKKTHEVAENLLANVLDGNNIIDSVRMMKGKDEYIYTHSLNVAIYASMIGKWLKLPQNRLLDLATAGLLHDLGKAKLDIDLLNKPGKLTAAEYAEMKKHSLEGYNLLMSTQNINGNVAFAALCHHEKLDGGGYPMGLSEEDIPLYARIIAVADIYDAMTSKRAYKEKVSPFKVVEQIISNQYGELDPNITHIFVNKIVEFYKGTRVLLSNGEQGVVVFTDMHFPTRPIVLCDNTYINLAIEKSIEILDVV